MTGFYVYALCYPDGTPFYIGKGQHRRMFMHEKDVQKEKPSNPYKIEVIRRIQASGQEILKRKLAEFSDEREAYMYEWALINMTANNEHLTNCLIMHGPYREKSPVRPKRRVIIEKPTGVYSIKDMATMLGKNKTAIYYLIRTGRINATKINTSSRRNSYEIRQEEVDAFFQPVEPKPVKPTKKEKPMSQIFTVKQVAQQYGVDEITILRRIREKKLKAMRTNGNSGPYRITQDALDEFEQNSMLEVAEQGV